MQRNLVLIAIAVVALAVAAVALFRPGGGPDGAGLQPGDPIVAVTVPAELSATALLGARAFRAACSDCHGPNASGKQGFGPPLVHRIYEPSHHADMAFVLAVQNGVRSHHWGFGDMPPVDGVSRAEVATIIAYVRALQRANGIE